MSKGVTRTPLRYAPPFVLYIQRRNSKDALDAKGGLGAPLLRGRGRMLGAATTRTVSHPPAPRAVLIMAVMVLLMAVLVLIMAVMVLKMAVLVLKMAVRVL